MSRLTPLLVVLIIGASGPAAAGINIEGLTRTCNNCHGVNGVSAGQSMPSIAGLSEAYLKKILMQWKTGERFSANMGRLVKGYSDAEIAAIAGYYSRLPWVPAAQRFDARQLAHGKDAVRQCVTCHGDTGAPDDDVTPRLNGQWAKYMELELMKYRDEAIKMPNMKNRNNSKKKLDEKGLRSAPEFFASQK